MPQNMSEPAMFPASDNIQDTSDLIRPNSLQYIRICHLILQLTSPILLQIRISKALSLFLSASNNPIAHKPEYFLRIVQDTQPVRDDYIVYRLLSSCKIHNFRSIPHFCKVIGAKTENLSLTILNTGRLPCEQSLR